MGGKLEVLGSENFDAYVESGNVIIDFFAEWCGPCRVLGPNLEEAAEDLESVKIAKINVDDSQDLAQRFGIMSIPTVIFFKDKEQVDRVTGVLSPEEIIERSKAAFK